MHLTATTGADKQGKVSSYVEFYEPQHETIKTVLPVHFKCILSGFRSREGFYLLIDGI